jgi:hypothetical protein
MFSSGLLCRLADRKNVVLLYERAISIADVDFASSFQDHVDLFRLLERHELCIIAGFQSHDLIEGFSQGVIHFLEVFHEDGKGLQGSDRNAGERESIDADAKRRFLFHESAARHLRAARSERYWLPH